tara:strand:- start:2042 stop:2635 length:594 start_codon:yes stop_codon:yes gene_type:complete
MYRFVFKRLLDFIVSFILLVILTPFLGILFVLVKLDSPGPFIFSTPRIGRGCQTFIFYKIRTMNQIAGINANDKTKPYVTTSENDKRITKIGVVLRKFHLDELPQLINVLIGDMSLIGVRPDAPSQISDYKKRFWVNRHLIRPGITGLSQIHSGDPNFSFSLRNKYDLFYVKSKQGLSLDLHIVYRTVLKVTKGDSF